MSTRFEMLTRQGCHLCDRMEETLRAVLGARGVEWELVDVDSDARLEALYGDTVPVLLREGTEVARIRIARRRLERLLENSD